MEKTLFEHYPDPAATDPCELHLHTLDTPLDWTTVFGADAPVEIEIGSGKGRFLVRTATENPERNYLGIERALKFFRIIKEQPGAFKFCKYLPCPFIFFYRVYCLNKVLSHY